MFQDCFIRLKPYQTGFLFWKHAYLAFTRTKLFPIHIPIWQHGSCVYLAMASKPSPIFNLAGRVLLFGPVIKQSYLWELGYHK